MSRSTEQSRPTIFIISIPFRKQSTKKGLHVTNQEKIPRKTFNDFLRQRLHNEVPDDLIPRRLRLLGHVAILWLRTEAIPYKDLIGEAVLEFDSKIRSVLRRTGAISGSFRQPSVEIIAGSSETETVYRENGVTFHLDPMKVMFSIGNKEERLRMSKLGSGEIVIDMFAGIGQFSLPMAVHARPKVIHAIEWNPEAFAYLQKNIQTNRVADIVIPHFGDTREITPQVARAQADRIIMGLIEGTSNYFDQAVGSLQLGGHLHVHELGTATTMKTQVFSDLETAANRVGQQVLLLATRQIKTYNPRLNHFVLDIKLIE